MSNYIKYLASKLMILLVCLMPGLALAENQNPNYSNFVVFGDSLSDTGNLAVVSLPPPYFNNRISDGPVAVDILAAEIGHNADRSGHLLGGGSGFNYAVAGGNILGDDREDLNNQISAYLTRVAGRSDPNALYMLFIGGNDLRDIRNSSSQVTADTQIAAVIEQLDRQISRLVDSGVRYLLVPNVANIGRLPETLVKEQDNPGISARAEIYTQRYNGALRVMLSKYRTRLSRGLIEFDLFSEFEVILNNPTRFGFSETEKGCFDPSRLIVDIECVLFGFGRRVFFDQLHPSSATNRLLAGRLIDKIAAAGKSGNSSLSAVILLLLDD